MTKREAGSGKRAVLFRDSGTQSLQESDEHAQQAFDIMQQFGRFGSLQDLQVVREADVTSELAC